MDHSIQLNRYSVSEIRSGHGIYKLGHRTDITDEGSYYRIDGTFIIDKFRIQSMELKGNRMTIHMNDQDVILIVEERKK